MISQGQPGVTPGGIDPDTGLPITQTLLSNITFKPPAITPAMLGIQYSTRVNAPAGGYFMGSFANIQTMTTTQLFMDNSKTTPSVQETWQNARAAASTDVLDSFKPNGSSTYNSVFYYGRVNDPNVGTGASSPVEFAPVGSALYGNDTPRSDITNPSVNGTPIFFSRIDNFTVTVMYNPYLYPDTSSTGQPWASIWIPVGSFTWTWGVRADYVDGSYVTSTVWQPFANATAYTETKLYPTWNTTIEDQKSTWVKTA